MQFKKFELFRNVKSPYTPLGKFCFTGLFCFSVLFAVAAGPTDSTATSRTLCDSVRYSKHDVKRIVTYLNYYSYPIATYKWDDVANNCRIIKTSKYLHNQRVEGTAGFLLLGAGAGFLISGLTAQMNGYKNFAVTCLVAGAVSTGISVPLTLLYRNDRKKTDIKLEELDASLH